jgi:hypothetical protein
MWCRLRYRVRRVVSLQQAAVDTNGSSDAFGSLIQVQIVRTDIQSSNHEL